MKARAIVEPWTISIAALALSFYSLRDGLILAYVALDGRGARRLAVAAVAQLRPCPTAGGRSPARLLRIAARNMPLAGADAIEWGSRRLDICILGLLLLARRSSASIMSRSRSPRCRRS